MSDGRFALIGAGFAGLGIAAALKRRGISYDQFDANGHLGGNWFRGTYDSVHTITSRRRTAYADFPMPEHYPDFPHRTQVLRYLEDFAAHHGLREHLSLGTAVTAVTPEEGERWRVELGTGEKRLYRGVVIATGQQWSCRYASYPGTFTGEVLHSRQYHNAAVLAGKRVLVVGAGNSGADIASEAARCAASCHLSMRHGYWFLPKTLLGVPTVELLKGWLPLPLQRLFIRALLRLTIGPYERYGLPAPDHSLFELHPTITDQLLYWLRHGRIHPRPEIRRLEGRTVEFIDGTRGEYDLICYATGYEPAVPVLPDGLLDVGEHGPRLVAGMFVPRRKHLYVFGIGRLRPIPRYGVGPPISAGAELVATCIETQERLKRPLGDILALLAGTPGERLMDPRTALLVAKLANKLVPLLPRLEPWLLKLESRKHAAEAVYPSSP